jgi:alpha-D-ribose 1-methylphosphonate 5-triphosphate diphosphatase
MALANARVVARDAVFTGTVHVDGEHIAGIAGGGGAGRGAVDLEGDYLIPGAVELHTDVLEHHATPRPGVRWPLAAAVVAHDAQLAAAGITTVLDGLAVGYVFDSGRRPEDPRPLAAAVRAAQAAGLLRCEHFLHMRCEVSTEHVVEHFAPFAADPLVRLVSLMDHTPGQRQFLSVEKYRQYFQGKYGLSDRQVDALIAQRRRDQARFRDGHVAALVALCQKRGLAMASHDDATAAHVEEAAQAGMTSSEFPTTLEAARAARDHGLAVLAGGPNLVCGGSHSGNVAAAELAAHGLVDAVSSDYVPASLLHAVFLLHRRHRVGLPEAVAAATAVPARRVGLDDRGEITPGRLADLVRVHLVDDIPLIRGVWRRGRRIA